MLKSWQVKYIYMCVRVCLYVIYAYAIYAYINTYIYTYTLNVYVYYPCINTICIQRHHPE